jgi:MFS family permease
MNDTSVIGSSPWYRSLDRVQWKALVASNLGWTFDGFEVFALILTVGVALRQLLDAGQYPLIPAYAGAVIAISLLGWALGGLIGGVFADYIGRKRTMVLAILAYSLMTGVRFHRTGPPLPCCVFLSGSQSARSGRLGPRLWLSCGRTTRAAEAARSCNADSPSEPFLLPGSGW